MNPIPVLLDSARAWRTYIGGSLLDALHGDSSPEDTNFPEEWILSVVQARNSGRETITEGLSKLRGTDLTLKDYILHSPESLLGEKHFAKYGANPGVLIKIIDAGERLTVQVHPTKDAAKKLFHSEYGKTECWHILGGREIDGQKPCIYYGFRPGITREYWKRCFDTQDIPAMLGCLHQFPVKTGETFLIRGGIPHAIGAGCFLVEIQEPTDYSIRTERTTPSGLKVSDFMCHQGLGFERMFDCFTYKGLDAETTRKLGCLAPRQLFADEAASVQELVGYADTNCFRMNKAEIRSRLTFQGEEQFYGIYTLSGEGKLHTAHSEYAMKPGMQFFIPARCEEFMIENIVSAPLTLIEAFGPEV